MNKKVPIIEALNFAFETLCKNIRFFLKVSAIFASICFLPNIIATLLLNTTETYMEVSNKLLVFSIVGDLIKLVMTIGFIKITLGAVRKKLLPTITIFDSGDCFLRCVATGVLYFCLVMFYLLTFSLLRTAFSLRDEIAVLGLILLLIPTIKTAVKYSLFMYLVIDQFLKPTAALKASEKMTDSRIFQLLGFYILCFLLNIAGFTFFVVGLLVTLPLSSLAISYVYDSLLKQTDLSEFGITTEDQYSDSQDDEQNQSDCDS